MFSEALLEHFRNPRNIGDLEAPAVTVVVENPACGDILRLAALVDNGRVAEVRYRVRGCSASIAAGSALTEMMVGQDVRALQGFTAADVEARLGGLPAESKHAAALCVDGLRALLKKVG